MGDQKFIFGDGVGDDLENNGTCFHTQSSWWEIITSRCTIDSVMSLKRLGCCYLRYAFKDAAN